MPKKNLQQMEIRLFTGLPSVRFTQAEYKAVYNQYVTGQYKNLIAMMSRTESDSHVSGCIEGRISGFQKDFQITPWDQASDSDRKRAEWFDKIFRSLDMYNLLIDVVEAKLKIFSVLEYSWDLVDGFMAPISYKKWDQKYFKFDEKTDRFLIDSGKDGLPIPDHVMVCRSRRKPILLSVLRDFILKEFGKESWASFIETFGEPLLIGKYPTGMGSTVRDELNTALDTIARSARGSMPKNAEIQVVETTRNTGDHEKFVNVSDKSISIALLGHANAVEESTGMKIGENLQPYQVRRDLAVSDLIFIDAAFKGLVRFVYDLNWTDGRYPAFETEKSPPLDVTSHRENVRLAYEMGYPIHPEDVRRLGIRVDPEEEAKVRPENLLDIGGGTL